MLINGTALLKGLATVSQIQINHSSSSLEELENFEEVKQLLGCSVTLSILIYRPSEVVTGTKSADKVESSEFIAELACDLSARLKIATTARMIVFDAATVEPGAKFVTPHTFEVWAASISVAILYSHNESLQIFVLCATFDALRHWQTLGLVLRPGRRSSWQWRDCWLFSRHGCVTRISEWATANWNVIQQWCLSTYLMDT